MLYACFVLKFYSYIVYTTKTYKIEVLQYSPNSSNSLLLDAANSTAILLSGIHNSIIYRLCSIMHAVHSLQALKSLVDYDEDSDEEEKSEEQVETPAKRKKMDDT